jgi:hypothetical protein
MVRFYSAGGRWGQWKCGIANTTRMKSNLVCNTLILKYCVTITRELTHSRYRRLNFGGLNDRVPSRQKTTFRSLSPIPRHSPTRPSTPYLHRPSTRSRGRRRRSCILGYPTFRQWPQTSWPMSSAAVWGRILSQAWKRTIRAMFKFCYVTVYLLHERSEAEAILWWKKQ